MCVAQKRLCLSSLICLKGVVSYTQATVPQLHHLACRFFSASTVVLQFSFCLLFFSSRWLFYPCVTVMCNASVNSTCALPPPHPPGYCGPFARLVSPEGWGICKFYTVRGSGIYQPQGNSRAFDTHAVSHQNITTQKFYWKKTQIYRDWLICQGQE